MKARRGIGFLVIGAMVMAMTSASAASAFTEFTAAEGTSLPARQKSNQTIEAKAGKATFAMICTELAATYTVEKYEGHPKARLKGAPSYKGCTLGGLKALITNTCTFAFVVKATAPQSFLSLGGKQCARLEVPTTKCVMTLNGEQQELKEVAYKNEGANLVIEMKVGGVAFESATGKACGFETETAKGTLSLTGSTLVEETNVK